MSTARHALVTNDDGIDSPGLTALAHLAKERGYQVTIVAPLLPASGTGAGLTQFPGDAGAIAVERGQLPGLDDVPAYAVSAHPGMITLAAMLGRFGATPDVVLSGINDGSNLGSAVLHSGTAGAAMVAGAHGACAVAVSLHLDFEVEVPLVDPPRYWESAVSAARDVLAHIDEQPGGTVYNLNVPNVPVGELKPLTHGAWVLGGTVPALLPFITHFDARAQQLPTTGLRAPTVEIAEGSDIEQVRAGYPTIARLELVGNSAISWLTP